MNTTPLSLDQVAEALRGLLERAMRDGRHIDFDAYAAALGALSEEAELSDGSAEAA